MDKPEPSLASEDNLPKLPTTPPPKQITHGEGCWSWGVAHYECACRELAKAKGWEK